MGKKINTAQPIARVQENSWFEYSYLFGAYTLKNAGLFQSKIWVQYGQTQMLG